MMSNLMEIVYAVAHLFENKLLPETSNFQVWLFMFVSSCV
jgi:hypothetical protein